MRTRLSALVALGMIPMAALGSIASRAPVSRHQAASSITLNLAFSSDYVEDTVALTNKFWGQIKTEFEHEHPGVNVTFTAIPGTENDLVTKLSLLFRSSSTAPDLAQLPGPYIGEWASAGYLLPLNSYLKSASWWKGFPSNVQSEGTFGGVTYAANDGENDSFLFYDKAILRKAGIQMPWHPTNWQQIISAAKAVKKADPSVSPIYLEAGTEVGALAFDQSAGNLLYGTPKPTVFDAKTNKWVVDSPALRATFNFYHQVFGGGLGVPSGEIFSTKEGGVGFRDFPKGTLAIAVGSNWYGGAWTKAVEGPTGPYWTAAPSAIGVAPIPTENGQGSDIVSTLSGWDYAISKTTAHPALAFDLLSLLENKQNEIDDANWSGFVPPNTQYGTSTAFTAFAPPFNLESVEVLPHATLLPTSADFTIWTQGFNEATGAMVQNPKTTVAQAISIMKTYITNQLGSSAVESIP